jgi:RNA polymerase sigma-70 factor, ECF subfamily
MGTASQKLDAQPDLMLSPVEFAELYDRHYATVYKAALRITGNPADAEDVLQTVFLRILNQGARTNPAELPQAYFRRASANAAVDLLRRRVSHAESELHERPGQGSTEDDAILKQQLRRAIAKLPEGDAVLFLLRFVEGLSNTELAELFQLEKNNVAVRLHRIRLTLQAEMER